MNTRLVDAQGMVFVGEKSMIPQWNKNPGSKNRMLSSVGCSKRRILLLVGGET